MKKGLLIPLLTIPFLVSCTNPEVKKSPWGLETAQACYDAIGYVLPKLECDEFEFELSSDKYGRDSVIFYCYFETDDLAEAAIETYYYQLDDAWFKLEQITQSYYDYENMVAYSWDEVIGTKKLDDHRGIEVEYLASRKNSKPCVGIFAAQYFEEENENTWPNDCINYVMQSYPDKDAGKQFNIPELKNETGEEWTYKTNFEEYKVNTKQSYSILTIAIYGPGYDAIYDYQLAVEKTNNYTVQQDEETEDFYAYANNGTHFLCWYYYADYGCFVLEVCVPRFVSK